MSGWIKTLVGLLGCLLVTIGVVATVWGMVADKDVNSVGLAAIFLVGLALVYAGIFGLLPNKIGLGDKGSIEMQAAVKAVEKVQEAAKSDVAQIAQSPALLQSIVAAKDTSAASAVVEDALQELVNRMPQPDEVARTIN